MTMAAEQTLTRRPRYDAGKHKQKRRFGERRYVLDLAVAVMVLLVGRLVGDSHREIGHQRGGEIDQRMRRLRQDRERAGREADDPLADRQRRRRRDRTERYPFLFAHGATMAPIDTDARRKRQ